MGNLDYLAYNCSNHNDNKIFERKKRKCLTPFKEGKFTT